MTAPHLASRASLHPGGSETERTTEAERHEQLRQTLPATALLLQQRHAGQIASADIDAYVALNWLEWQGGGLHLTIVGRNVCAQLAPTAS